MKGKTGQGAAHGSKSGRSGPGSHGPSQMSSSEKEAQALVKKCGPRN